MTPYFATLSDFIAMNGHGKFVWISYAISFGCILFLIWYAKNERKHVIKKLKHHQTHHKKLTNKQRRHLNS